MFGVKNGAVQLLLSIAVGVTSNALNCLPPEPAVIMTFGSLVDLQVLSGSCVLA